MANNRELSQFGNYISVSTDKIVGISTNLIVSGIVTAISYYGDGSKLTGIATVGGGTTLGLTTITELNVTGVTSLTTLNVSGATSLTTLNVSGATSLTSLNVSGVTTLGVVSATSLNISGISTFGNIVLDPTGIITAVSGVVTYYGDGSKLSNVISGVGIATAGGFVGTGATTLDFRGPGISTVTVSAGIATINITGGGGGSVSISSVAPSSPSNGNLWYSIEYGRTFIYYDEVALGIGATAVWVDAAPFNQSGLYVSKYGDNMYAGLGVTTGSLSSPSIYFNGYTNSGFYSPAANQFGIVVSGTERLNVNPSGINITGVGTFSSNLIVSGSGSISNGLVVTGVTTSTDFNSSSDINLKENIQEIEAALETVNQLHGVKFDWKNTKETSYGVIAQEIEKVLPELVSGKEQKAVNYNGLIGVLIEAVKELSIEVQRLKEHLNK